MPSSRTISANGIETFLLEQGEGPLVVLCHGWPELSYSWRRQIPAIAAAGFRVAAPDMRGFGRTTAPAQINAYSIFDHVGDMVALVAALGERQAVLSAMIGARRLPGMRRCSAPTSLPRLRA
jgi:pimeloyl-ACP methyl ester carboxylesterase